MGCSVGFPLIVLITSVSCMMNHLVQGLFAAQDELKSLRHKKEADDVLDHLVSTSNGLITRDRVSHTWWTDRTACPLGATAAWYSCQLAVWCGTCCTCLSLGLRLILGTGQGLFVLLSACLYL